MLLENCRIFDGKGIKKGSISTNENIISEIGKALKKGRDEEKIDVKERLILPGLICAHTHAYSAFAFSFPIKGKPKSFGEILKKLWWPLDQCLDKQSIYWSAILTGIRYLRNGVTTLIDHHASPNALSGSLPELTRGFKEIGIRACLSYEVSDRYGTIKTKEAIAENERFIKGWGKGKRDELISALFGLHSSFTLNLETLRECAEAAKKLDVGFHLHLAEGKIDEINSLKRFNKSLVNHLKEEGILSSKTLAAHCVNLKEKDIKLLKEIKIKVITNPRSNAANGVGIMPLKQMMEEGIRVGIGNDAYGYDMLEEVKALQFMQSLRLKNPSALSPKSLNNIMFINNSSIASNLFKRKVGQIKEGAYADLVILDIKPFTNELNLMNLDSSLINSVMVAGRWIIKNKRFLNGLGKYEEGIEKTAERIREKALEMRRRKG
jgi:putative selenium metabolism protein SsnA